jgi:DNA damage-inducible protein 1
MAHAIQSDSAHFAKLLHQMQERENMAEMQCQHEISLLNMDLSSVEAQGKIEEAIQQQAVMENIEYAIEYSPESFGRVAML